MLNFASRIGIARKKEVEEDGFEICACRRAEKSQVDDCQVGMSVVEKSTSTNTNKTRLAQSSKHKKKIKTKRIIVQTKARKCAHKLAIPPPLPPRRIIAAGINIVVCKNCKGKLFFCKNHSGEGFL